jgi:hypothetical protein
VRELARWRMVVTSQTFVGAEAIGGEGPGWGIAVRQWLSMKQSWRPFPKMEEKEEGTSPVEILSLQPVVKGLYRLFLDLDR